MWTVLVSWFGVALAAVPVELPAGEPAAAWTEPARLAGAWIGPAGGAPSARVVAQGGRWTVVVQARDGTRHTLVVAAPADAGAREDLLATIVSLAEPVVASLPGVALPPLPPVPSPPAAKPAVKPAAKPAVKRSAPKAAPEAVAAAPAAGVDPLAEAARAPDAAADGVAAVLPGAPPADAPVTADAAAPDTDAAALPAEPEAVASALPAEPEAVAEIPPDELLPDAPDAAVLARALRADAPTPAGRVPLHARVATGAVVRLDADAAPFLEVAGGVGLGPVRAGLALAGAPGAALDADRAMRWLDVAVLAELGDRGPWGALRAGASVRGWTDGGELVATTVTPTARLDLGWGFPLRSATLRPGAWAAADLAPTTLYVDGVEEGDLARAFFGIDVGIEIFRAAK